MATHSSILEGRIPCTEEPDGLQSMGSQRDRHDWSYWARTGQVQMCDWVLCVCQMPPTSKMPASVMVTPTELKASVVRASTQTGVWIW